MRAKTLWKKCKCTFYSSPSAVRLCAGWHWTLCCHIRRIHLFLHVRMRNKQLEISSLLKINSKPLHITGHKSSPLKVGIRTFGICTATTSADDADREFDSFDSLLFDWTVANLSLLTIQGRRDNAVHPFYSSPHGNVIRPPCTFAMTVFVFKSSPF